VAQTSKHKQQLRRAKRRATIAENNEQLRQTVAQQKQYLQFLAGQAFEAKSLLIAAIESSGGLVLSKDVVAEVQKELTHLEIKVATSEDNKALFTITVEDTTPPKQEDTVTITKIPEDDVVDGSGQEDASDAVLQSEPFPLEGGV
jgi:hypothetical protein